MLKNLLNTEVVQVVEQVKDWREAVAISCRPLIENGSIEPRYVDCNQVNHLIPTRVLVKGGEITCKILK